MFSPCLIDIPEDFSLEIDRIRDIFYHVEKMVKSPQNGVINIAFINDETMQRLNREYRNINKTTDVLSFHYFDEFSRLSDDEVAGEIVLSQSKVISQSETHRHSHEREIYVLILHGLLHILGFDHETDEDYKEMWKVEEALRELI